MRPAAWDQPQSQTQRPETMRQGGWDQPQTQRAETVRPASWDQPRTQRPETMRQGGWDQTQREAPAQAYPAYPGPGETQRYTQPQSYYSQDPDAYAPAPSTQREPRVAPENQAGGYGQYDANNFYRQQPADYQTQSYAPQAYDRAPATERYPTQPAPKTVRESYYPQDTGDADQTGLMGGGGATQRYATQPQAYDARRDVQNDDVDPRAGNYPIARTTQDDELDADFFGDDEDFNIDEEESRPKSKKKLVAAVLASAVLVGGGGFYYYKGHNPLSGDGSDIPTYADTGGSVKEPPASPGGKRYANGNKAIYDRLGVEGGGVPTSHDATPMQASASGGGERGSESIDDRIGRALQAAKNTGPSGGGAPGQMAQSEMQPRPVSVFRVNPDGSMVQPAAKPAAAEAAPDSVGSTGAEAGHLQRNVEMPSAGGASDEGGEAVAPPTGRNRAVGGARKPEVVARVDAPTGSGYFAQVGARNDQNQALAALAEVQSKYGSVLGAYTPSIQRADLGAKGIWYRVRIGPIEDKESAAGLCEKLKGAGLKACLVQKSE